MGSQAYEGAGTVPIWRTVARSLGILALALALLPSWFYLGGTVRTAAERDFLLRNPDDMPFRSEFTLGWRPSPLVRRFVEATLDSDAAGGIKVRRSSGLNFDPLSWSMFSLAAGSLLLWLARDRRTAVNGSPDSGPDSGPNAAPDRSA